MTRLTEGLIHKNFVIISGGGVGPVNPPVSKERGNGEKAGHRAVFKGGIPSLKYGAVPSPLSIPFFLLLNII